MTQTKKENAYLDGDDLRHMILEACSYFDLHKESINALNVFPVPDGDTGTNMGLTMRAAARELQQVETKSIGEVAAIAAHSSLMGARGNSGVILSQMFRGISRGLSGKDKARLPEFGRAFQYGIVYAYNAVSKPVEGTILTVAREIAKGSREALQTSLTFIDLLRVAIDKGRGALEQTPELLPVLKEAGVVDAGGLGLVVFLEGCLQSMLRRADAKNEIFFMEEREPPLGTMLITGKEEGPGETLSKEEFNPVFPYCTEVLIKGSNISTRKVRCNLEELGDSLLVAGEGDTVKVHIHTDHPGTVLETCLFFGSLHDLKIDNMVDQFQETRPGRLLPETGGQGVTAELETKLPAGGKGPGEQKDPGQIGVVTVSSGEGLAAIFTSLGADQVVSGGQSMNPSVQEIVEAIVALPTEQVIVLPNNSNIRLSAEQAVELVEKEVMVVDTRSVTQGLAALLALNQFQSLSENHAEMCRRASRVKTGEITYAVRAAVIDSLRVEKGDIIGISNGRLLAGGKEVDATTVALAAAMLTPEDEILTLFYGDSITGEQAQALQVQLVNKFPGLEVELQYGGQPLYYYFLLVE
ncbi:MAG: DAK2 domain-containing protein [Dethiobacteria bacterium]|jgi:DAK2 domain fusion protein YloV